MDLKRHTQRQHRGRRLHWIFGMGMGPIFKRHCKRHSLWIVQLWIYDIYSERQIWRSVWTHLKTILSISEPTGRIMLSWCNIFIVFSFQHIRLCSGEWPPDNPPPPPPTQSSGRGYKLYWQELIVHVRFTVWDRRTQLCVWYVNPVTSTEPNLPVHRTPRLFNRTLLNHVHTERW